MKAKVLISLLCLSLSFFFIPKDKTAHLWALLEKEIKDFYPSGTFRIKDHMSHNKLCRATNDQNRKAEKTFNLADASDPPRDSLLVDEITEETAFTLQRDKDLHLIGTGARMRKEIAMLAMSFYYYHEVDLVKARELLVFAIREYLQAININEEIRPYLKNYPFKANNLEIKIWIFKPGNKQPAYVDLGKITYMECDKKGLRYYFEEENNFRSLPFRTETYEEALLIVEEEEKKEALSHVSG